jgi:hypothetical protein
MTVKRRNIRQHLLSAFAVKSFIPALKSCAVINAGAGEGEGLKVAEQKRMWRWQEERKRTFKRKEENFFPFKKLATHLNTSKHMNKAKNFHP